MKQNVLLSMLAMTVPMAAFADANVPTAKDVYSSVKGTERSVYKSLCLNIG